MPQGLSNVEVIIPKESRSYVTMTGYFLHDSTNASGIPAIPPRFGLIDESPGHWVRFFNDIDNLNRSADHNTSYKVFFLGRHGQGYHNVGESKYGTQAWDDYWSLLEGDGELVWGPDPELTAIGEGQATDAHNAWKTELDQGIPLPYKLYCSPLTRAIKTCEITFDGLLTEQNKSPIILENCREENGVHTCDKRRTRSYIAKAFPSFQLEPSFSEEDLLWDPKVRESKPHLAGRAKQVLDHIFGQDRETFISITAHGGFINGFLASIGRPAFALPTGGILPVVVKSVRI